LHPASFEGEIGVETALVVMTEDERRQQARELIREAFAERPMKLIEATVVDPEESDTIGVSVNAEVDDGDTGSL